MADLTAIILTYNEEKNIGRCIKSLEGLAKRVVVIDSGSSDKTTQIAKSLGAEVLFHEWENYSKQYIWGEKAACITSKWIFRIDADEHLTKVSAAEINNLCQENENTDVNGLIIRFKVNFMGKDLKHGGIYPFKKLLVYKNGIGYMEDRNMDEHIVLSKGKSIEVKNDSIHQDYKDLNTWINKHNNYSSREVMDYFSSREVNKDNSHLNYSAKFKRFIKFSIYYKLPIGTRAHLYYLYRYYIKLGFLDGKEGKIFAFLQAYWYRYLVDAKIYELKKKENIK